MEVSHSNDRVTHAVIGGQAAMSASMDDSPEFFAVLSDTLYSDKPRATVREVLCNAWDIHIQSGKQHIPVKVTLDSEYLIIEDQGPGIHPDMIEVIYLRYGKSTKKHDGKQTGGFGLGSKAPWSYTDHFEVASCHMGTKTLYKMSKSVPELEGRPGAIPLITIPCGDQTGLTVKIPIKMEDRHIFERLVKELTYSGEMNVLLNGTELPKLEFSKAPYNWVMLKGYRGAVQDNIPISVRYGNVIYPIPQCEELNPFFKVIKDFLEQMPRDDRWNLVLMAAPHTISVTPSRESLSMGEHTISTLGDLLEEFCSEFNRLLKDECLKLMRKQVDEHITEKLIVRLWSFQEQIPGLMSQRNSYGTSNTPTIINDFPTIISAFARQVFPTFDGFKEALFDAQIEGLIRFYRVRSKTWLVNDLLMFQREVKKLRAEGKQWDRTWKKNYGWGSDRETARYNSNWLYKRMLGKLYTRMQASPDVIPEKLQVHAVKQQDHSYKGAEVHYVRGPKKNGFLARPLLDWLPFLRRIVVITHRTADTTYRISQFPIMREMYGEAKDIFYYTVPRSPDKVAKAVTFFEKHGFEVIDLTKRHDWEPKEVQEDIDPIPKTPPKPKAMPGLPLMKDGLVNGSGRNISSDWWQTCKRSEQLDTIIQNRQDGSMVTLDWANPQNRQWIADNWGSKIGIAVSSTQVTKYEKLGAIPFETWIAKKFKEELNDEDFKTAYMWSLDHYLANHDKFGDSTTNFYIEMSDRQLIYYIMHDPVMSKVEDIQAVKMTDYQAGLLGVWQSYFRQYNIQRTKEFQELNNMLKALPVPFTLGLLIKKVKENPYVDFVNMRALLNAVKSTDSTKANIKLKAKALLINILKG